MVDQNENIASKAVGAMGDFEKSFRGLLKKWETDFSGWGKFSQAFYRTMEEMLSMVKPFSKVQSAAAKLVRPVGLAGDSIMGMSKRMIAQNKNMSLSMNYGMSNEQIFGLQEKVMSSLGRNVKFDMVGMERDANGNVVNPYESSELQTTVAAAKEFGDETVAEIAAGYDKIGKSMLSAAKATGKLYQEAGETGINLQKYAKNFIGNLQMAQTYNFKRGVDGLKEMAKRATEIRQDMQQVARFADKVGTVTGAVETAANLQVLGGSFTALANPLSMLNESLTDVEGLQKRLANMTNNMATYNQTTKQIELDPLSRMRLKAAAEAMGVDSSNLIDQAYAQARKTEIERQLTGIGNIRPEVARLISNVGEINEQGIAGATIGERFYTAGEIAANKTLQDDLVKESRTQSDDIKVIAKSVLTIEESVAGRREQLENEAAINKVKAGVVDNESTWKIVTSTILNSFNDQAISAIGRMEFPFDNLLNGFKATVQGAISDIIVTPMNADTIEEWKSKFQEGISNNLGEGPIANAIADIASFFGGKINSLATGLNDALKEVGVDFITVTKRELPERDLLKQNGLTEYQTAQATAPAPETGSQYSLTRPEQTTTMPTITGAQIDQATIAISTANFADNFGATNGQFGLVGNADGGQVVINGEAQRNAPIITGNETSIPGAVVQNNGQVQQTENNQPEREPIVTDVNVHFDGTITVNGDNGKIGTAEIMKMLENNQGFRQEISKSISDSLKKMKKQRII